MANVKCIGWRESNFTGKGGEFVEGANYFFSTPIDKKYGDGVAVERVFISANKMKQLTFNPVCGDECIILYNKYGKVADIRSV